jgi:hypothetical protein
MDDFRHSLELEPVGYAALIRLFPVKILPHYRSSFVAIKGRGYAQIDDHHEKHVYSRSYLPKEPSNVFWQLEFALKYDGLNLEILAALFQYIHPEQVENYVRVQPTARYARIIWYLYEWLTDHRLAIADSKSGNYVLLLDSEKYYTGSEGRSRRHRVINNLLGNKQFCPMVRKTSLLDQYEKIKIENKAELLINSYDPEIITRAIHYLYAKETISSYAIEREKPDSSHEAHFIDLLRSAEKMERISKEKLLELQNAIVEPRFKDFDYRIVQNYIGEQASAYTQKIHYISPKPENVRELMEGWLSALESMQSTQVHPIIFAAAISFGFVFIHPFEDGNGRLHRFLIHYILSRTHFTPGGFIFPVSSVMLKNIRAYDAILETFSIPLLKKIRDYELTPEGELRVKAHTKGFYQYIDYTRFAEYLFKCVIETVETVFKYELEFIKNYDITKRAVRNIVDMPDKLIDLIIKFTHQNNGKLSDSKRSRFFYMLKQNEIHAIEKIVSRLLAYR